MLYLIRFVIAILITILLFVEWDANESRIEDVLRYTLIGSLFVCIFLEIGG